MTEDTFQDEINLAGSIATASTKAMGRAALIGVIPILEFGLLIAASLLIVSIPIRLLKRWENG
jgi:hypothetical protein